MPYSSMTKDQLISEIQRLSEALPDPKSRNDVTAQETNANHCLLLLINKLPCGFLSETNQHKITLANQQFCDMFALSATPQSMFGADSRQVTLQLKNLCKDGEAFVQRVNAILAKGKAVYNEFIFLQDGRTFERDFVHVDGGQGHVENMWFYRDVTLRIRTEKALSDSEARYRNTLDSMLEGCQIIGFDWKYIYLNDSACRHAQCAKEEMLGHTMMELFPGVADTPLFATLRACMEKRQTQLMENEFEYSDGSKRFFQLSIQPVPAGIFILSMDITEQKQIQKLTRKSEEQYRLLTENISDVIWILDLESRRFRYVSPSVEHLRGYTVAEVMSQDISAAITPASLGRLNQALPQRLQEFQQGQFRSHTDKVEQPCKDGRIVSTETTTRFVINQETGRTEVYGVSRDITERTQIESERETAVEFLRLLNKAHRVDELVSSVIEFIQQQSGCEAVGIRLRKGPDYPYYETQGFAKPFVLKENQLCLQDKHGQPILDESGSPVLECMCGNVLCGRFDPGKPFFTEKGSFWTNSTTELLSSTTEQDRQARTRNRCNGEGYESVALLALRAGPEILGLLQMNDRRKGRFTAEAIARWERLTDYLAVALTKLKSDEALRENEEKLRLFIEHAPAALAMFDRDMRYLAASQRWLSDYELGDRPILGLCHYDLFPEIPENWKLAHRRGLAGEIVRAEEDHFVRLDGTVLWQRWQVRPWFLDQGGIGGIVISVEEITERKLAEDALRQSEQLLRTAIDATPDFIFVKNRDFRYVLANKSYADRIGFPAEEIIGKSDLELGFPEELVFGDPKQGIRGYRNDDLYVLEHKASLHIPYDPVRLPDGTEIVLDTIKIPLYNQKHEIWAVMGVGRDQTARHRAEQEKTRLEEQLRRAQKLETIGTLAGGIAHDFNNLLTPIMGYADMVLNSVSPAEPIHEDISHILKAAGRAKDLVEQILIFSREIEKERVPVLLHLLVSEALKLLRPILPSTIEIRTDIDSGCDKVMADASQMHQVIVNLCTNAFQAMEKHGGILTLALKQVRMDANTAQKHPNLRETEYICLTVGDTGMGMDEKTKERIFEPFFTTKEIGKGTGMGLSVVHGIVQSHHGEILVHSERGKGSVFHVYLPVVTSEQATSEPISAVQKGYESILLADDDEQVLHVLEKMLSRLGYTVTAFSDSKAALDAFNRQPKSFDLVIFDLIMPDLTGLDLSEKVHAKDNHLPIIIMTGYGENISQEKRTQNGIRQVIVKPVTLNELASTIRIALAKQIGG